MFKVFASQNSTRVASVCARWQDRERGTRHASTWNDRSFVASAITSGCCLLVAADRFVTVGIARLESCDEQGDSANSCSAPALAVRSILAAHESGEGTGFTTLVGKFAFVIWDRVDQELTIVRDQLGLGALYYKADRTGLAVSDCLDALDGDRAYNIEFIADFISSGGYPVADGRTIWSGVRAVPPGSIVRWKDGHLRVATYWSPDGLRSIDGLDLDDAAREFRRLLERSVMTNLDPGEHTWAHLSGGLDSSSVVAVTADLTERGRLNGRLGGTITMTESIGNADETRFVDAVVRRSGLRNERVPDEWPWRSDGDPPPLVDQPERDYPLYARERVIARILKSAGATSLLSGVGRTCICR